MAVVMLREISAPPVEIELTVLPKTRRIMVPTAIPLPASLLYYVNVYAKRVGVEILDFIAKPSLVYIPNRIYLGIQTNWSAM